MSTGAIARARASTLQMPIALVSVALFSIRVALEATNRPWPGAIVISLATAATAGSALLGFRWSLRHRRCPYPLWPAGLLMVYVLWPSRNWLVAGEVMLGALVVWTLNWQRNGQGNAATSALPQWTEWATDGGLFLLALGLYWATLSPDVLPADSGEFQLVAARWGVAHPPGFPLYTILGALFVRLAPVGTPAYRLNLLSAILAAATLVLIARATRLWAQQIAHTPPTSPLTLASGLAAALALGSATTFWAQATVANIRTPSVFCVGLILYNLARFTEARSRNSAEEAERALLGTGVALGLGLGHHPSLIFAGLFYVLYLFLSDVRLLLQPKRWWRLLVAVPVGVIPFVYLPIRGAAGAVLAPPNLDTLPGLLSHIRAKGFAGDMFAYANPIDFPHRAALLPTLWTFQFNTTLLSVGLAGLVLLLWCDWRLFVLLGGSLAVHTFVTITYRAPQTVEYLMPAAYPPVAVAAGLMPFLLVSTIARRWPSTVSPQRQLLPLLIALTICAGLQNGLAHGPSFSELAKDRSTRQKVAPLLEHAPADALLLADWHWVTPMWYLQQVEGMRPDMEVRYVYNVPGQEYRETWRRRVEEIPTGRPLILTHFYEFAGYTTEPWWTGFRLHRGATCEPTVPLTPADITFGNTLNVLGYRLEPEGGALQPGEAVECVLAWKALRTTEQPPSFTLRLIRADGAWVAQADRTLVPRPEPGTIHFERLVLPLYPWLTPGVYHLTLGAYIADDTGFTDLPVNTHSGENTTPTAATLTDLWLQASTRPPYTMFPQSIPFTTGPVLVGVDYDRSQSEILRVYLHWRGPLGQECHALLDDVPFVVPAIPAGAYQTTAVDLPGSTTRPRLTLKCDRSTQAAGIWGWALSRIQLPIASPGVQFVPLGADIVVRGARAHTAPPGGVAIVDVQLVAQRPLVQDIATSVRLMDREGNWLARHDMQPVLGALPTLKWIRGSRVVDRHLLAMPTDYTGDIVQATLVAYERFRETPLAILDERFNQVPLGVWLQPR